MEISQQQLDEFKEIIMKGNPSDGFQNFVN